MLRHAGRPHYHTPFFRQIFIEFFSISSCKLDILHLQLQDNQDNNDNNEEESTMALTKLDILRPWIACVLGFVIFCLWLRACATHGRIFW